MHTRDWRDLIGGAAIAFAGLFIALYATANYSLGTLRQMGPGMFPTASGIAMLLLGVAIAIPAFFRAGDLPRPDVRSAVAILGSIGAFAAALPIAGLVPAIVALVLISSLASGKLRMGPALLLCLLLSILAYLLFVELLGAPIVMIRGIL